MRASLIVIAWNGLAYLPACLDSIVRELGPDDELIVVDNHSQDQSVTFVKDHYPQVRVIRLSRNRGYAGGINCGVAHAQGDLYFFFNQDVELRPGWLAPMVDALGDPSIGVVGCKLLGLDGLIQHAGGVIHWPRAIPEHFGHYQSDEGQWDFGADVGYVTGAAWGFSSATLVRAGTLDERFWPGYYEEVDFCCRVTDLGLRIRYVPAASAVHTESGSFDRQSQHYLVSFHTNRMRFVLKRCSPMVFLAEFVPAEHSWLKRGLERLELDVMSRVYKRALLWLADLRASVDGNMPAADFCAMVQALSNLHEIAAGRG